MLDFINWERLRGRDREIRQSVEKKNETVKEEWEGKKTDNKSDSEREGGEWNPCVCVQKRAKR